MKFLTLILLLFAQTGCISKSSTQIGLDGIWVSEEAFSEGVVCKGLVYGVSLIVEGETVCQIQLEPNMCMWGRVPEGPVDCSIRNLDNGKYIISSLRSKNEYVVLKQGNDKLLITDSSVSEYLIKYKLILRNDL